MKCVERVIRKSVMCPRKERLVNLFICQDRCPYNCGCDEDYGVIQCRYNKAVDK